MRFNVFIFCFLFCLFTSFTPITVLTEARKYYVEGSSSKVSAMALKTLTENQKGAIYKAYYGASHALLAKHYSNPFNKLESLKKGLKILNEAVEADGEDIEVRFIRFSIEENIPSFISFTRHFAEDKTLIIDKLSAVHPQYAFIKNYMLISRHLTDSERKKLN